jgi:hypothetical protein
VFFQQGDIWRNPEIGFTEVDKIGDLKNIVRVEVNQLDLVVV